MLNACLHDACPPVTPYLSSPSLPATPAISPPLAPPSPFPTSGPQWSPAPSPKRCTWLRPATSDFLLPPCLHHGRRKRGLEEEAPAWLLHKPLWRDERPVSANSWTSAQGRKPSPCSTAKRLIRCVFVCVLRVFTSFSWLVPLSPDAMDGLNQSSTTPTLCRRDVGTLSFNICRENVCSMVLPCLRFCVLENAFGELFLSV